MHRPAIDPPVALRRMLIANRGEVAIRIARACADLAIASVAVYTPEDAHSLHLRRADQAVPLPGRGAAGYLHIDSIVRAALDNDCDAVHPGYGFLSENAGLARACAEAGLRFIGPRAEVLALFGDKAAARGLASRMDVPLAAGTGAVSLAEAHAFMASLGPDARLMVKAVAGGGGRGMRVVEHAGALDEAYARAASEARAAFGVEALYVEELIAPARHVEVQIMGDASGQVVHVHDRECSLQRRQQKLIEIAPSFGLSKAVRARLVDAALRMAAGAGVHTLCTFEFLVDASQPDRFVFMEANPRLQVEHTVTEAVTGIDLVCAQIQLAAGASLASLGLTQDEIPAPRGCAIQLRINMESIGSDGSALPASGTLRAFDPPSGAAVRIESQGYTGYTPPSDFDSLLAKLIVHEPSDDLSALLARAYRALGEFRIDGIQTNIGLLQNVLQHPDVLAGTFDTRFVERNGARLAQVQSHVQRHAIGSTTAATPDVGASASTQHHAGPGVVVPATLGGRLVSLAVGVGDAVRAGQQVAVIESMKMEHAVAAPLSGIVLALGTDPGAVLVAGSPLLYLSPQDTGDAVESVEEAAVESSVAAHALQARRQAISDQGRPEAVARQRKRGMGTARERIDLLCDPGTFHEIGGLISNPLLERDAPADGLVAGSARIDGRHVMVVSQDFTVLGGSSGHLGESKMLRVVRLCAAQGLPLVMLLDGGGHRIQDGQSSREYAPVTPIFMELARISGWVPVVSAVLGFGFAANTNYSSMADLVIMVRGASTMGLSGPALVKAGTGEEIDAESLGGAAAQVDRNGLADLAVNSEDEALVEVRRFLSYLPSNARCAPPRSSSIEAPDASKLASVIPANTRRTYDVRRVIAGLADRDSEFEFKPGFATSVVTTMARLNGQAVGFIANQPMVRGGMLDAPAAEKASRFLSLCDAFGLPLIYLVDIPGLSIGSGAEASALGRRSAKMLFELGHATVPRISVVMRKGYGLGYLAMCGGRSFDADAAFIWPTAEICAMSVEGSVDVAYRKLYEGASNPAERRQELIDGIRAEISALKAAEGFGVDDLIEPEDTRNRLIDVLERAPARRTLLMPAKFRGISPI